MDGDSQREDGIDVKAVIQAQGLVLATIAALLERSQACEQGELWRIIGLLSAPTSATDPQAGYVLAMWADIIRDLGPEPGELF